MRFFSIPPSQLFYSMDNYVTLLPTAVEKIMKRPYSSFSDVIPRKDLEIPRFHERIPVPRETMDARKERYKSDHKRLVRLYPYLFRFIRASKVFKYRWLWYKIVMHACNVYMKLIHRLTIRRWDNGYQY